MGSSERNRICFLLGIQNGCLPGGVVVEKGGVPCMLELFAFVARHGRYALAGGLLAGFLLPDIAQNLRHFLPQMILFLLFLTAFRIGAKATLLGLRNSFVALKVALIFQLVLPLVALAVFIPLGLSHTTFAIVIVLMLAAPSVTATPNITLLLGHDPEPAFRLLIVGTAILPLTIIPIFWLSPALGHLADVFTVAVKLLMAIWCVVMFAFAMRRVTFRTLNTRQTEALDGFTSLVLATVVIGLMSAVGPALQTAPLVVFQWVLVAVIANMGAQILAFLAFRKLGWGTVAVPFAVVAGNRNFALFLIALPAATTDPLLIFLGCYQVPMYLTALVMRRIFNTPNSASHTH